MAGRMAIVTGSESGIGRATAVALAEQGCDIGITWFRDEAAGAATAEGGILQMGPVAGSHLRSDDWRRP